MSIWPRPMSWVRSAEGGFSDHALDRGGPTNVGVALRTVSELDADGNGELDFDLDGDGDVDRWDILALKDHPEMVAQFYRVQFWERVRADELPPHIALAVFDSAILHGPKPAIVLLQKAIGARPDGIIGAETLGRAQWHWADGLERLLVERLDLIRRICEKRPDQMVFWRGWSRRVVALQREALFLTRDIASGRRD